MVKLANDNELNDLFLLSRKLAYKISDGRRLLAGWYIILWWQVTEAIQIGVRAIKENKISVEEVQLCLEELDESINSQKLVENALGIYVFIHHPFLHLCK